MEILDQGVKYAKLITAPKEQHNSELAVRQNIGRKT